MIPKTWPYGTQRTGTLIDIVKGVQFVKDDQNEIHVLMTGAGDMDTKVGDKGTLTFTQGGPTGGYWKFKKA
jgi:hypothetical protein